MNPTIEEKLTVVFYFPAPKGDVFSDEGLSQVSEIAGNLVSLALTDAKHEKFSHHIRVGIGYVTCQHVHYLVTGTMRDEFVKEVVPTIIATWSLGCMMTGVYVPMLPAPSSWAQDVLDATYLD